MGDPFSASRSFPSLQSFLSSQNLQGAIASSPSIQQAAPTNLYNGSPYATDNFNQMLNDVSSRPYGNNYRQPSARYTPLTRSSTETRASTETRSSTPSLVVKA